jgi:hypothetical protein
MSIIGSHGIGVRELGWGISFVDSKLGLGMAPDNCTLLRTEVLSARATWLPSKS